MAENKNRFPGFIGPAYKSRSERFDAQRLVNFYIEMDEVGTGKGGEPAVLIGTPGLSRQQVVGNGPIRCTYTQSNAAKSYIVSGNKVYTITGANALPELVAGSLASNEGPVQAADNGQQVIFVDGTNGYYIDTTILPLTLTQIIDPNFHATDTITFQDGYFIGVDKGTDLKGTGAFFISDLYSIDFLPLNEANASGASDILVGAISCNRELYLLGAKSLEIWFDQGSSAATPFQRQDGRFSQVGCAAPNSIAVVNETFFWLGSNSQGGGIVYTLENAMPTRVSNHAVEYAIQGLTDLTGATAYSYQQEGHYFYCLNIPGTGTTWVYDTSCKQWHERQSTLNGVTGRHLGNTHCILNGKHIVGDYRNGNIYIYDLDVYTDDGEIVNRIRQAPHISQNLNRLFYRLLEVDMQFGVGLSGEQNGAPIQGSNPRITLEISNDGGETWSNPIYAAMGKIGRYNSRARWQRLGSSRDRVFRLTISEPVRATMLSAYLDVEQGSA
jgi:hypothetical protein